MSSTVVLVPSALALLAGHGGDPRSMYDVQSYRLELRVDPQTERITGTCTVQANVTAAELGLVQLDMHAQLEAEGAWLVTPNERKSERWLSLEFEHHQDLLTCTLPATLRAGTAFELAVRYSGAPKSQNDFDGFHWKHTMSGEPWIGTSCQGTGSKFWWPCKDSFFHPDDKPERFEMLATVPKGLYAVSNGRLVERTPAEGGQWETFHWRHGYPLETYAITLNVAPYVVVEAPLELAGIEAPVPFVYYVLPEAAEKARVQFAEVPELVRILGEAFGPFPFPKSKVGFVHTPFWGMEHSTAIAYGSSFPAWIAAEREREPEQKLVDRFAPRNADYDYILVHEFAHEWWGNAVSAADWADFWLHEGFATYAEGVYVEKKHGREAADRWWQNARRSVQKKGSLFRGEGSDSDQAYAPILYHKGAWVLHTLRHFVADDEAWWKTLREFNLGYRYKNARTSDFRVLLEHFTGSNWERFFAEWFMGSGYPKVEGKVTSDEAGIHLRVDNQGSSESTFHVPLDLAWFELDEQRRERFWLVPGANEIDLPTQHIARDLRVTGLERMLGSFDVRVVGGR